MGRGGAKAQHGLASSQMVYSCVALNHLLALQCPEIVHVSGQYGEETFNTYHVLGRGSHSVVHGGISLI